jgi:hypothetical protein
MKREILDGFILASPERLSILLDPRTRKALFNRALYPDAKWSILVFAISNELGKLNHVILQFGSGGV